jgi:hypothetical protein
MPQSIQRPDLMRRHVTVLALVGPARAGKTTAALELVNQHGLSRTRFADTLKAMISLLGVSTANVEGDFKEQPLPDLCGRSTRYAMTTLGTGWGRMMGHSIWAHQVVRRINDMSVTSNPSVAVHPLRVVIDDLRYPHELEALIAAGFDVKVVRVWNPLTAYPHIRMWLARRVWGEALLKLLPPTWRVHSSEAWWPTFDTAFAFDNSGNLDALKTNVNALAHVLAVERPTKGSIT